MVSFYETEYEIWDGFGQLGSLEFNDFLYFLKLFWVVFKRRPFEVFFVFMSFRKITQKCFVLLKFSFSEKGTKNWKNLPLVLMVLSKYRCFVSGRFFPILWPFHNVLTKDILVLETKHKTLEGNLTEQSKDHEITKSYCLDW